MFAPEFHFGCATSAYQVEGGIENDWSQWERQGRLLDPSVRCGRAVDHWRRAEADFELLQDLGATAYRLSVEWARVEPEPGRFDQAAIDRYAFWVHRLADRGIEPVVTFMHFTHPPWFHRLCPWHEVASQAPGRFAAFVARMMEAFGDRVRWFTILNEPLVWLLGGTLTGVVPPGEKRFARFAVALPTLLRGYLEARQVIRQVRPDAACGIAKNVLRFAPERPLGSDRWLTEQVDRAYNHVIPTALTSGKIALELPGGFELSRPLDGGEGALDFIGVNYYTRVYVRLDPLKRSGGSRLASFFDGRTPHGVSDLGWEIHPDGLAEALRDMSRYGLPLWVTENGIDDRDDTRRARFLVDHLAAVQRSIEAGVDVRGYLHWSLVDNFEWLEGFGPRFGLYRVERPSLKRAPTSAVPVFRDIIRRRSLPERRPPAQVVSGQPKPVMPGAGPI
jgi:beta-glucosidase